ncbi:MAG: DNA cytosine methyltransferase [Phycisphaerae bacterium]
MSGVSAHSEASAPTVVEFFCGAGGLSLGLIRAGFKIAAAYDLDSDAVSTYHHNIGPHCFAADVSGLTTEDVLEAAKAAPGEVSLVAGGPPCQGFSVQRRDGRSDARNSLSLDFSRLIRGIRPAFFLFENVPGIRNRHGQEVLQAFVQEMTEAKYVCHTAVLNAVNYGVPQFRKRVFVVGELSPSGETSTTSGL